MDYMYSFGILTHNYSVYGIIFVIFINLFITWKYENLQKLRRVMVIFTPLGSVMLASAIFTGVVMMAAKHLAFSLQNIMMIIAASLLVLLEIKRAKALRNIRQSELTNYKKTAYILLLVEFVLVVATVGFIHATAGKIV